MAEALSLEERAEALALREQFYDREGETEGEHVYDPSDAELLELRDRERRQLLKRSARCQLGESFLRWQGALAAAGRHGVDTWGAWTEGEAALDDFADSLATFNERAGGILDGTGEDDFSAAYEDHRERQEGSAARLTAATHELEAATQRAAVARARAHSSRPARASLVRALTMRVPRARETRSRRVATAARTGPSDSDSDPPRANDVEDELAAWLATIKAGAR